MQFQLRNSMVPFILLLRIYVFILLLRLEHSEILFKLQPFILLLLIYVFILLLRLEHSEISFELQVLSYSTICLDPYTAK